MTDRTPGASDRIGELADSFVARFRAGERPSVEEYVRKYPELASQLRSLLPALALLELQGTDADQPTGLGGQPGLGRRMPREIGEFLIVGEIGRGGMGVVYEAVQQSLGRHVALKVLSSGSLLNPRQLERFRLEARSAARLHHGHIVPVFGVGEADGLHFYAMQFIAGQNLDQVIDELRTLRLGQGAEPVAPPGSEPESESFAEGTTPGTPAWQPAAQPGDDDHAVGTNPRASGATPAVSPRQARRNPTGQFSSGSGGRQFYESVARVGLQVAEALAYAHGEGILHRDIKPSNLILDANGNTWITDFGLVKAEDTQSLTDTGEFVGTLRYMAPERLEGWSDRRSDLYSLGATLYELLTLHTFFENANRLQLVDQVRHKLPPAPTKIDSACPRDLETIVLKAIAKEPGARYLSADEMAEDLRRFLADRPILARRSTPRERLVRWCRRSPLVASLAMVATIALLAGTLISTWQAARATRAARIAEAALREEAQQRAEAVRQRVLADANQQRALLEVRKSQQLAQFLKDMLNAALPAGAGEHETALLRQLVDRTAQRISVDLKDQPELDADMRRTLGWVYQILGRHDQAETMFRQSLQLDRQHFGDHQPVVFTSLGFLGFSLVQQEKLAEAEAVFREALAAYPNLREATHPELHFSVNGLAGVLQLQGKLDEAEAMYREAIAMRGNRRGEKNHMVANSLSNLGGVLREQGRLPEAEICLGEALAIYDQFESHDRAATLLELGIVHQQQGRLAEAEATLRGALDMQQRVFREPHTETAETLANLASVLYQQQRGGESQVAYGEAVAMRRKVIDLMPRNPASLAKLAWLLAAVPFEALRDPPTAVALARRAVELAPESPSAWRALGAACYRNASWTEAVEALQRSVTCRHQEDPSIGYLLAMSRWQLGQQDEARAWYGRSAAWLKTIPATGEVGGLEAEASQLLEIAAPAKTN